MNAMISPVKTVPLLRPTSVNGMFLNVRGRGRVKTKRYMTWRRAAEWEARKAGPIRLMPGPVHIDLYVSEDGVGNMDLDNTAKAYLDLFVDLGLIEDDNKKIVRSISLRWVTGQGRAIIQSLSQPPAQ